MKISQISDFQLGRVIHGFFLCKEKHLRHTRSGDLFLDLIFGDSTGTIPGKLWDLVEEFQCRFKRGDPVSVKGIVTEYNDHLQLSATQVNYATEKQYGKYGFSPDLLLKTVDEPLDNLWNSLMKVIESLQTPYKKFTQSIFMAHKQKIRIMPGSINYPIRGGFLKHLVTTAEMSIDILPYYSALNKNLVLSGILLHDIGKVESISDDLQAEHTDAGKLIGHCVLGIDILREAALSFKNFPKEILLKLEHIIYTYESVENTGSLRSSRIPEALFIHYIDSLDKQLNHMLDAVSNDSNSDWTDPHNHFQSELYKK